MPKEFNIETIVRPNIRVLKPYHSARDDFQDGLLLDANENSLGAPAEGLNGLHRYPSPEQRELRQKIAAFRGVDWENVFVGAGSDEIIDLLYRIFCRPGHDRVLITPPTFGMYQVAAQIHNIAVDEVPLDSNFQPRVEAIIEQIRPQTKLLFLCSPNNPTGNLLDRSRIDQLIDHFSGIVVIDEAYIDFSDQESYVSQVEEHPNLVVLQTMSKAFGLAAIRLGIAIAPPEIIRYLMKVKTPYNINQLTSQAALEGLEHTDRIAENIEAIKHERGRLRKALEQLPAVQHIYESEANFLLVKIEQAKEVHRKLAVRNIIVRYRGDEPGCGNCLRITVGTKEENKMLVEALGAV
jgi:histidinol-phosphate aminotransferase